MKMTEKFDMEYTNQKNASKEAAMLFIGMFAGFVVVFDVSMYDSGINKNDIDVVLAVVFSAALTLVIFVIMRKFLPTYYEADESSVTVRHLWEKLRINYSDISGLCLQRYDKPCGNGIVKHFERLSIMTDKGKLYVFDTRIEVDHEKTADDPDALQKQFDNAKLSRLRKFITYNIGQGISGREILTDPRAMGLPEVF